MTENSPPLAGVVGWPISHSKSPLLHGYWLKKYGISGHYVPIGLKPQDFETGIRALPKLGFAGVNLTIPYKEAMLAMADSITDRASLIGAANTVTFRGDGSIHADNTDSFGFIENVRSEAPDWVPSAGPALVLGAGGASRSVVFALLNAGVPEVRVANRTRQRAEILREHFGAKIKVMDWNNFGEAVKDINILVNSTALGMVGKPKLQINLANVPDTALVTDIVYTPLKTELLLQAEERGLKTVDGLGMLLYQAVPGFESWFEVKPEVDQNLRNIVLGE